MSIGSNLTCVHRVAILVIDMMSLGEKIKKRRLELRLSLDELAQKSKVSKAYLSQLETGKSERPSGKVLYNIAAALGISIADLLGKKLLPADQKDMPDNLKKAAVQYNIPENYLKILLAVSMRTSKKEKELNPEDWFYLYETIKRVKEGK